MLAPYTKVDVLVVLWLKVLPCGIVVSEFELQWRYYIYFRTNTLMLQAMG